ncbi:hypothetical protein Q5752_004100 [Cryptotrichosporon argae]
MSLSPDLSATSLFPMSRSPRGYIKQPLSPRSITTMGSTADMLPVLNDGPPGDLERAGPGSSLPSIAAPKDDYSFFHTKKFKLVFLAMFFNIICFALDQFILTVAVPQIVSQFNSLDKLEWLNTAFFIPCAGAILIYSQIMTVFSPKWCYIAATAIFEAGCVVCGAASSMNMLIVGRAIAGLGGAGIWNATYLIAGQFIPFEKRTSHFSLFGLGYILASVMGPLIGGAFTDMSSSGWRWCFYVNLPIGGVALALCLLSLPQTPVMLPFDGLPDPRPRWSRFLRIDWVGSALTFGFVTCIGIGLQYGGVTKAWNSGAVIGLLAASLACFIVLILWSIYMGDRAMVPMSLMTRRHYNAGLWVSFFGYGTVVCLLYYLSIYFEAIKGKSAVRAGVLLLGLQLSMCPVVVIVGRLAERTGQVKAFMLVGGVLNVVGIGLMTMVGSTTSIGEVVGFEVVVGIGIGLFINLMMMLMQADYMKEQHLVSHATNVFNFWGFIGRIIGLSVGTNIFQNKLHERLASVGLSASVAAIVEASPDAIWTDVPADLLDSTLKAYATSLSDVWWWCLGMVIINLAAIALMRNLNLKELGEQARLAREASAVVEYPLQQTSQASTDDVKY